MLEGMSTHKTALRTRPSTPLMRVRRLVAAVALTPLLAVAACSDDGSTSTPGGASTGAQSAGSTEGAQSTGTTGAKPSATAQAVKAVITDPVLGHKVTATKLVRNVPWPAGNPVGEASFEIVAVEITWKAGSRYSADLRPWMLTLTTDKTPYAVTTTEFGTLPGTGKPLVAVARDQERSGWVYFKVDRGSGSKVTLSLQRPEYKISTTGKTLPRRTFSATLTS